MTKELDDLKFPDKIGYCAEHVWVKKEDEQYAAGITDYAQDQLGEIVFVELPEMGDSFKAGEIFGTVESMKTISDLIMPISGEIAAVNSSLTDKLEIINQDPYLKGWLIKIRPSAINEIQQLMTAEIYVNSLKSL